MIAVLAIGLGALAFDAALAIGYILIADWLDARRGRRS